MNEGEIKAIGKDPASSVQIKAYNTHELHFPLYVSEELLSVHLLVHFTETALPSEYFIVMLISKLHRYMSVYIILPVKALLQLFLHFLCNNFQFIGLWCHQGNRDMNSKP